MRGLPLALLALGTAFSAAAQQASPQPDPAPEHSGTVIFSRSLEGAEKDTPASVPEPIKAPAAAVAVTDAERQAITFLAYDLDVHLQPREHALAIRARVTVRNDATAPLPRIPLQLSSTLEWKSVRTAGVSVPFTQSLIDSDSDHTGVLREAVITLSQPLAPHQSLTLDLTYEGGTPLSAKRLENAGTPSNLAEASDWDRVDDDFVGLRGFGNVVWYPVASKPVALGDGALFFTEAAAERQRQSEATLAMHVTEEFFGTPPNLAVLHGEPQRLTPVSMPTAPSVPGIVTCSLPSTRMGMNAPSLFLVARTIVEGKGVTVFARKENAENAQAYLAAALTVQPTVQQWLGVNPRGPLSIVDLAEKDDAPFEAGGALFVALRGGAPDKLASTLVHSLTHMYFRSPYAWLQEGVPAFLASLWLEQSSGRNAAILQMDDARGALSLAEPELAERDGDARLSTPSLLLASDPVHYRTKAVYVLWMLRAIAGDDALQQALQGYQAGADKDGTELEDLLSKTSNKDLRWFFDDWVYHDRGLPDLAIAGVFPNKATEPGAYLVAVDVSNSGTAEAEVPVSVSSGTTTVTDQLRVPAKSRISHRFLIQGPPVEVAVNDGTVPEVQASIHKQKLTVPAAP